MKGRKCKYLIIIITSIFIYVLIETVYFTQYKTYDNRTSCTPITRIEHEVKFYKVLSSYYEYRYELTKQNMSTNESRLILLLTGRTRACVDWWNFSVGETILSKMRSSGFSILAICTKERDYSIRMPIQRNLNVYGIYITLQIWMKEIYYKHFQHYPRLYLFGVSQGSRMSSLLCRVLPIQAQILYIAPGYRPSLLLHSDYERNMHNRLIFDPVFANWFYFEYCFQSNSTTNKSCPFHHLNKNYLNPVPPTYFIHAINDKILKLSRYTEMISSLKKDAFHLGGILLTHNDTIKLSIAYPLNITSDYMTENFNKWFCKPWSSQFFYEHYINSTYKAEQKKFRTCSCIDRDFFYFNRYPHIIKTWSKIKQEQYYDYIKDFNLFKNDLCEQICGDLLAHHAMMTHHIDDTLNWLKNMDYLRFEYKIQDFLNRPLRLWMYNKSELVKNTTYLTYQTSMKTSCGRYYRANQMYSSEYFLQDYFQRLKTSYPQIRHNFIWSNDPLLADYYIIPHDYICISFDHYRVTLTDLEYRSFYRGLNQDYFLPLLMNIQTLFPYWNMTSGSNHLIAFTSGKNMAIVQNSSIQKTLKDTIQLAFTGFRQDLLPHNSLPLYIHRNITPIYRHNYDIILPSFDRLQRLHNQPIISQVNWNEWYKKKKHLLFFAGTINNSVSQRSIRQRLLSVMRKTSGQDKIIIDEKQFNMMTFIDGSLSSTDYADSIRSTVFHLCLEGFSPWSPRLYESICLGAIPLILAESIVLPFERFINWHSFSAKINVNNVRDISDLIMKIDQFEEYVKEKLKNATMYFHAFRWPYSSADDEHLFLPEEDLHGTVKNVFHYLSLELRCRRLEQFYGLTSDSFSLQSINAKQQVCTKYSTICPCYDPENNISLKEYS